MKKEAYSHKDFTLASLKTDAYDRINQFTLFTNQLKDNDHEIYWIEAKGPISPTMNIQSNNSSTVKEVISFVSNDYLGMSQRRETIEAGIEGIKKYGTGACAAPIIGGYLDIHRKLEEKIAKFTGQEDALIFSSGFGANSGTLSALMGKEDIAFIDSSVHSSVLDGLRSTNTKQIGHNNLEYLEFILQRERKNYKTKMVVIDGVYSQDGDLGLIPEIHALCRKYDALLYVDDAHGVGVFGENGRGVLEHYDMFGKVDILTGTFSKAFGCVGGFAAGSKLMIQYLRYYANTTVFSAAVTPQVTFSVLKALELIEGRPEIHTKLWDNTKYLHQRLLDEGYDIGPTVSPIIPLMIRDDYKVKEVTMRLQRDGIYTIGIVYPAVRTKDGRIRLSVTALHERVHIEKLLNSLSNIDKEIKLKK